jgi:5-methylcytosine-specific restriction enzyme subunit McrC
MAPRLFTAVEHGALTSTTPLVGTDWDRLMRSAAHLPADVLRRTKAGVRAGPYVGILDFGWCQVEVLPRIADELDASQRRTFLLNVLGRAGLVPRPMVSRAAVLAGRERLLEALVGAFAEQLHDDLIQGVPRRYHVHEERLPQVKGRIIFAQLARSLPSERHLTPVRYAPLQYDNPITQTLRALVAALSRQAVTPRTLEALEHCDRMLGAALPVPLTGLHPGRIRLTRQESRWRPYLDLAAVLKAGHAPIPISHGEAEAFGLLFSLHDVFERLVRRALSGRELSDLYLRQRPLRPRLLHPLPSGTPTLPLRPDLLFENTAGAPQVVADTKWKDLSPDARSLGLTPADVYQVAVYMAAHAVPRGLLLFPERPWMEQGQGLPWHKRFRLAGGQGELVVGSVDVVGLASSEATRRREAVERLEATVALSQNTRQDPAARTSA